MTPFIEKMAGRAARAPKRIAFPEAENPDILRTAQLAAEQGMGRPVLLAELGSRLYALEGVENYRFSAPAADLAADNTVLPVLGTLTVTELEA